ncbi:MAG: ABC transporter substrate-binding protein [Pseudomonadota bacterium]
MRFKSLTLAAVLGLAATAMVFISAAEAKTFRFANDGDVASMDPYNRNETFQLGVMWNVYEGLVRRDQDLKLEGALATEWSQAAPNLWRFKLRPGVKFHDGTPFTADDVVLSMTRASTPPSNMTGYFASVKEVRAVDPLTVEFETKVVDPLLDSKLNAIGIMSKAWAEKHGAQRATDVTKPQEENYSTRNANGTGPFMLKSREPDVRTVFVKNPNWWDKATHNIDEVVFSRIASDPTRVAALLSGEVDMIYTVPPQDTDRLSKTQGIKIMQGPETRVVYLGFDQARDELLESNIKGKNPFKDKRVREAFYRAIDIEAIKTRVMRGQAFPVALMVAPGINGYAKDVDVRPKYDPDAAKKLLADSGYPAGFEVGMDCPNDRYVNDEAICLAVVAMLARIGVKVNLLAQTRSKYFAKILGPGYTTSFYMLGWSPAATYDVHNVFEQLLQTRNAPARKGAFNVGGYSNPQLDALTNRIEEEADKAKRDAMILAAHKIYTGDFANIPLHQQALIWAMRSNVEMVQPADNSLPLRYLNVK